MTNKATMEDTVVGDSTATLILQVSQGEELAGRHYCPVTALEGGGRREGENFLPTRSAQ